MGMGCCDLGGGECTWKAEVGAGAGFGSLLCPPGPTATCCLHQKDQHRGQHGLKLAGSRQRQPQKQQKLGLTQNMPETSRKIPHFAPGHLPGNPCKGLCLHPPSPALSRWDCRQPRIREKGATSQGWEA